MNNKDTMRKAMLNSLEILKKSGEKAFRDAVRAHSVENGMNAGTANTYYSIIKKSMIESGDLSIHLFDNVEMDVNSLTYKNKGGGVDKENATCMSAESEYRKLESEEEGILRIERKFNILDQLVKSCAKGQLCGLMVSSAPGMGKTHTVLTRLQHENVKIVARNEEPQYSVIRGKMSGIALYQELYHSRDRGFVLVLDDVDPWADPEAMNLLKAALDDKPKRRISWRTESKVLRDFGIPKDFVYEGSCIFLTNLDPENSRSENMKKHAEALSSRVAKLDLDLTNKIDRLLRIKQVASDGLFDDIIADENGYGLSQEDIDEVIQFVEDNFDDMKEQSVRSVKNIAKYKLTMDNWVDVAIETSFTQNAKFKILLAEKKKNMEQEV